MQWIDLLAVLLLILMVISIKPVRGITTINEEYFSPGTGNMLRGLCSFAIVFHHLSQRVDLSNAHLFRAFLHVGYICVAFFLFSSGYGLQKSYLKSDNYKKGFLQKRLSKILLPFLTVAVLCWIKDVLNGISYSIPELLLALFTGSLVSFSWYIICISCFYLAFWVFMHLCGKNHRLMILCACIWVVVYIFGCKYLGCDEWWFNTPHLLVLGMIWATYEADILRIVTKHYLAALLLIVLGFSATFLAAVYISAPYITLLLRMTASAFFVPLVLLLSLKATIDHPILNFVGDISLDLFLIHGLWITGIRSNLLHIGNDALFCFVVLGGSIVSAVALHKFTAGCFKRITGRKHAA